MLPTSSHSYIVVLAYPSTSPSPRSYSILPLHPFHHAIYMIIYSIISAKETQAKREGPRRQTIESQANYYQEAVQADSQS